MHASVTPGAAKEFEIRTNKAIDDVGRRKGIQDAMRYLQKKRIEQFKDSRELDELRSVCESIRQYSLANLPRLLEQLETKLTSHGVNVHWAETPAEANAIVLSIAKKKSFGHIVKGKSMVSEEIGLNHALEKAGIEVVETDMGEYIVQLAGETPSHIIMPAIHKSKQEIGRLFSENIPGAEYTEDVDELIRIARGFLRKKFEKAEIGISGVNFAVAETGTLCLVENEGNGRMCTTVPSVHIAVTGIEKVVEKLEHVAPLYSALTKSATGQAVSTYLNLISGPRKPEELDGPEEVHLILVDNGRTNAYINNSLRKTLQCIRCGACMNHCPVYARIGGHGYGTTYPGPIGAIISPHLLGLKKTYSIVSASTLCGACAEVCPVRIPITDQLIALRHQAVSISHKDELAVPGAGEARKPLTAAIWRAWQAVYMTPALYRFVTWLSAHIPTSLLSYQGGWTASRVPLLPKRKRFRDWLKSVPGNIKTTNARRVAKNSN